MTKQIFVLYLSSRRFFTIVFHGTEMCVYIGSSKTLRKAISFAVANMCKSFASAVAEGQRLNLTHKKMYTNLGILIIDKLIMFLRSVNFEN